MPQLSQRVLAASACLVSLAGGQPCTADWGTCQAGGACCSPQFACQQKNQWYWQCVLAQQAPARQQAQASTPAPLPTLPPLPTIPPPAPQPDEVVKVDDQLQNLEGGSAKEVSDEVSKLSQLAAELSEESRAAVQLASQLKRPAGHSAAEIAQEAARVAGISAQLREKVEHLSEESAEAAKGAQAASKGAEGFSAKAAQLSKLAAKLPGADKVEAVQVLLPESASAQPAAEPTDNGLACPNNADLNACIAWCNKAVPNSQPTLAGNVCSKMGTSEVDFGMLPQCECYDSKMESVLKRCTSSCRGVGGATGSMTVNALEAVKREMVPRPVLPLDIMVLYSTHCAACRQFVSHGLEQLIGAGLPGREVNVSLLPLDAGSAMARTQLCAMKQTQLQPMSVDGPSLRKGLDYIVCCDLAGTVDRATAQRCATQSGFDWASLDRCAESPEGRELVVAATRATSHVQDMLKGEGFLNMPGIPWVFVQGTLLRCSGAMCAHEIVPAAPGQETNGLHEGGRPLTPGGGPVGFVEYVCSRLSPQPPACKSMARTAPVQVEASGPQACENCFTDLGRPLSWRPSHASALPLAAGAGLAFACAVLLAAALRLGAKRREAAAAASQPERGGFSPLSLAKSAPPEDSLAVALSSSV